MISNEEVTKAVELMLFLEKHFGMDLAPLTIGAMSGAFEGLASEGRTITIERKSDTTAVTLRHPDGDEVFIEKESLLDVLLEMFQRMQAEDERSEDGDGQ